VENRSRHTWCTNSHFLVRLTYHLYSAGLPRASADDGTSAQAGVELVSWDNPRTALPAEIAPGDAVTMALQVTAPQVSGDYVAEIDLLQEYISWFAEKGTQPRRVRFAVV